MTENIKALIAILILAVPALVYLHKPLTWGAIQPADYRLRAGLWLGLTVTLFLAYSFWLFMLVTTVALVTVGRKDSNPLGLYFFLVFVAPPFHAEISGFGGINRFLDVDYLRLLSIVILLPTAIRLRLKPQTPRLFKMPADKYLLAYIALMLAIQFPITSSTDELRSAVSFFIDIFLPYYAMSRGLSDGDKMRDALASFAAACAVMAVIAVFELLKGWLLYSSLPNFLNVVWGMGGYMMREGSLRATVSTGHSIILGYVLTVGLGLHMALRSFYPSERSWRLVLILIGAGIFASFARGPWVGAAALVVVMVVTSDRPFVNLAKLTGASVLALPLLMLTGVGQKLIALLPFLGAVEDASVDYRTQLFDVSWDIFMMNPLLGSPYYMWNPAMQQMRQGEGIIDMVNSYLGVALPTGSVGLFLFVSVFGSSLIRLVRECFNRHAQFGEGRNFARALLAVLVGVLVTIATASSIGAIPVVYWCLAGACAAFLHLRPGEFLSTYAEPGPQPETRSGFRFKPHRNLGAPRA
jgi:hypothetical protein